MFFYKVEGHMPKLSSFGRGKTIRPKKSLTSLFHAALQLFYTVAGSTNTQHLSMIYTVFSRFNVRPQVNAKLKYTLGLHSQVLNKCP